MPGLFVNHPATPSGLALVPARGLSVADRAGLRGTAGALVPAVRAWAADAAGNMQQFWPTPPVISALTVGASEVNAANWKTRHISWSVPGATSFSLTRQFGANPAATIYTGSLTGIEWDWFDAGPPGIAPGTTVVFELTATNGAGSAVTSVSAPMPTIPAPAAAPVVSSITDTSFHLDWSTAQVFGAVDYVDSQFGYVAAGTSRSYTGLIHDTHYYMALRSRHIPTYLGAPRYDGPNGPTRTVITASPSETGPPNGTYTIEPTAATYQYGGGQPAGWRSTSDDYFHGDGSSYGSNRGQQVTCFYYARPSGGAWAGGIGTKNVTAFQIYLVRQSGTGTSSATTNRWGMHTDVSRPSGAPNLVGAQDIGSLAWGAGAWFNLPVAWGVSLVNATYRGVYWGKVAGRYMSADRNPGAGTPNGTIKVTIGN